MEDIRIEDESGDKKYFTIIPNYILNHSTLWDREVYIQMKRITGEDGTCWTSQETLSKQCGISINRLKKSLTYLIKNGWIYLKGTKEVNTQGGKQKVNEYMIADLWKKNIDYYESKGVSPNDTPMAKGVSRNDQRGVTNVGKGVSPRDDKEEPFIKKNNKEERGLTLTNLEINELQKKFTKINVTDEYDKAKDWLISEGKRKTERGYQAFFRNWLRRADIYVQDKQGITGKFISSDGQTHSTQAFLDEYEAYLLKVKKDKELYGNGR